MPQMSPIYWIFMLLLTLSILMLILIKMHFFLTNNFNKIKLTDIKHYYMTLKNWKI